MSERSLASIQKIVALEPIEGKDRIVLAEIQGWHVIVAKDAFAVGDLVIYCQYDTILPVKPEFEFLRSRCYSAKYDGFRIKNMKMAGVFSEGIVFSTDIISTDKGKFKEDKDVSKILGVQKYDPEALKEMELAKKSKNPIKKFLMRYKWFRKMTGKSSPKSRINYPMEISKASETNIQVIFNKLKGKGYKYYKSEKLEGQAACYHIDKKGKFKVYSHNVGLKTKDNNWWRVAEKFDIENKMKNYMKEYGVGSMYIMGEIVGPGIQKNIYSLPELDFYIYDVEDLDKSKKYGLQNLKNFAKQTGLKLVPILEENVLLLGSSDAILQDCEGVSVLGSTMKNQREGIIWRTVNNKYGFKAKSKKYQSLWDKKDVTE